MSEHHNCTCKDLARRLDDLVVRVARDKDRIEHALRTANNHAHAPDSGTQRRVADLEQQVRVLAADQKTDLERLKRLEGGIEARVHALEESLGEHKRLIDYVVGADTGKGKDYTAFFDATREIGREAEREAAKILDKAEGEDVPPPGPTMWLYPGRGWLTAEDVKEKGLRLSDATAKHEMSEAEGDAAEREPADGESTAATTPPSADSPDLGLGWRLKGPNDGVTRLLGLTEDARPEGIDLRDVSNYRLRLRLIECYRRLEEVVRERDEARGELYLWQTEQYRGKNLQAELRAYRQSAETQQRQKSEIARQRDEARRERDESAKARDYWRERAEKAEAQSSDAEVQALYDDVSGVPVPKETTESDYDRLRLPWRAENYAIYDARGRRVAVFDPRTNGSAPVAHVIHAVSKTYSPAIDDVSEVPVEGGGLHPRQEELLRRESAEPGYFEKKRRIAKADDVSGVQMEPLNRAKADDLRERLKRNLSPRRDVSGVQLPHFAQRPIVRDAEPSPEGGVKQSIIAKAVAFDFLCDAYGVTPRIRDEHPAMAAHRIVEGVLEHLR